MILNGNNKLDVFYANTVIIITALFWLIAKLMSYKLWVANRLFPLIPPFEFLDNLPIWYHIIFFGISLCCLVIILFKPSVKIVGILFLSELFSLIADQNRWQPWEYQYLFIILLFLVNRKHLNYFFSGVTIIMISIYFYSGLCKLNPGFLQSIWSYMLLNRFLGIPHVTNYSPILFYAGYCIGTFEIAFAVGLCFKKTRKIAALLLIAVHGFNLLFLGPLGINYNSIVWPWNIAMIAYLYFLFIRQHLSQNNFLYWKKGWNKLTIVCWMLLPMLYYFGSWDAYLSSALYSGNIKDMIICIKGNDASSADLPASAYAADFRNNCDGHKMIIVSKWAISEMNVPVYPEKRVYLKIKKYFSHKYPGDSTKSFLYYKYKKEKFE